MRACAVPGAASKPAVPEPNSALFLQAMRALFPGEEEAILRLYPPQARHFRLNLRPDGSCVFLGGQGCVLPQAARPRFCGIFPFWVTQGVLNGFSYRHCQAAQEHRGPEDMLEAFGLSRAGVFELYAALRQDWGFSKRA